MQPTMLTTDALDGGFTEPAHDAAHAFRAVMAAMACPGTIHSLSGATPPAPLSPAAGAALLTLCDADTPVHLAGATDTADVRAWIAFHCGAPMASAEECTFALGAWAALMPLSRYAIGSPEYPDRSATLIVESPDLDIQGAQRATLTGPGIRTTASLPLPAPELLIANAAQFPLGVDVLFTCGARIAALPRSTRISLAEAS